MKQSLIGKHLGMTGFFSAHDTDEGSSWLSFRFVVERNLSTENAVIQALLHYLLERTDKNTHAATNPVYTKCLPQENVRCMMCLLS